MGPEELLVNSKLLSSIDYAWKVMAAIIPIYIFKDVLRRLWIYVQMRWSFVPYCSRGNRVRLSEDGPFWIIYQINLKGIYLERENNVAKDGIRDTKEMMRIPLDKYWDSSIIYNKL